MPEFTLDLTFEQADIVSQLLDTANIKFDPATSMIETDPEDDAYWVMRSSDLDHLISELNGHLEEHHPGCRIPQPQTLEQRHQALRLAYWEFEWRKHSPSGDLWTHNQGTWADVARKYPVLFSTPDTGGGRA